MILPGWETLESTSSLAKGFTYVGFGALFLLGVCDVMAHVYSVHNETLRQAGRHLNDTQIAALSGYLADKPKGQVTIKANASADDARAYANEIAGVLNDRVGWTVRVDNAVIMGVNTKGIWITIRDANAIPVAAPILHEAFEVARIPIRPTSDVAAGPGENEVWLSIGFKP